MENTTLFSSSSGDVTVRSVQNALYEVGAHDCDILYIHTGISFGLPVSGIKRKELLGILLEILQNVGVRTLVFPTFTFSFCNNEIFDVQKSKTSMGAINEFARKSGQGVRSKDPLLSVYVLGDPLDLVDGLGENSLGPESNYDRIHQHGEKVKFLFLGAKMEECFTYTHHMEAMFSSPYRYYREFCGTVVEGNKQTPNVTAKLFSTYANCTLNPAPIIRDAMSTRGQLRRQSLGESSVCCFSEQDAYTTIAEVLQHNPYALTDGTFDPAQKSTVYAPVGRVNSVL